MDTVHDSDPPPRPAPGPPDPPTRYMWGVGGAGPGLPADEYAEREDRAFDRVVDERDFYIRLFNRLSAAVTHHHKNIWGEQPVHHDEDKALYKAHEKILADATKGPNA